MKPTLVKTVLYPPPCEPCRTELFLRNLIPRVSSRALQQALVDLGLGAGLYRVQIFSLQA